MRELRHAVGLRSLGTVASSTQPAQTKLALPSFKQYREKDGLFYFKMVDAKGQTLLQSLGFATPKEAGQAIARLQTEGAVALPSLADTLETLSSIGHQHLLSNLELLTTNHGISQK
jgi:tryptophanyl-tRNA synthetase